MLIGLRDKAEDFVYNPRGAILCGWKRGEYSLLHLLADLRARSSLLFSLRSA
jgi:hypothetical protein